MSLTCSRRRSRRITIFGGKLRTASPGEFVFSGLVAFVAFVVLGSVQLDTSGRGWKNLFDQGMIDRKEYYENRFRFW
jgi:hypothetical protein